MKRNLDLARHLLLDIENRGTDCSVSVLRTGSNHQSEEQIRYHLRLLIDADLLKEIDRTSAGVPCVRLTHDGHEFLELARNETRWQDAKFVCQERIGGLALAVIRGILTRWAVYGGGRSIRYQRVPVARRLRHESYVPQERTAYRVEPFRTIDRSLEREYWEDDFRIVNGRPDFEEYRGRYGIDIDGDGRIDLEYDTNLPGYLI